MSSPASAQPEGKMHWNLNVTQSFRKKFNDACLANGVEPSNQFEKLGSEWLEFGQPDVSDLRIKLRRAKDLLSKMDKADPQLKEVKAAVDEAFQNFKEAEAEKPEVLEEKALLRELEEVEAHLAKLENVKDPVMMEKRTLIFDLMLAYRIVDDKDRTRVIDSAFSKQGHIDWDKLRIRAIRDLGSAKKLEDRPAWAKKNKLKNASPVWTAIEVAIRLYADRKRRSDILDALAKLHGLKGKAGGFEDDLAPSQTSL